MFGAVGRSFMPRASDSTFTPNYGRRWRPNIGSILRALFDHAFSTIKTNLRLTLAVVGVRTQITMIVLRVTRATVA